MKYFNSVPQLTAVLLQTTYLILEFIYLRYYNIDDASEYYNEVEGVPRVPEVILNKNNLNMIFYIFIFKV